MEQRQYRTEVLCETGDKVPAHVSFSLGREDAEEIVRLAAFVRENGLQHVVKSDGRAIYHDEDLRPDQVRDNTEAGIPIQKTLIVYGHSFSYQAKLAPADATIGSLGIAIKSLAEDFGISVDQPRQSPRP